MKIIDKYFKEKTDKLTFIELKENSFIELKAYIIKDELPLPILTQGLIEGITKGEYNEGVGIKDIIEGVIYTIGTDTEFPYVKEYKEILYAYEENIVDYIFYRAIKDLENEKYDDACIKLRTLLVLEPKNTNILFNYGLGIEALAKKFIVSDDEKGEGFLNFSTNVFESILDVDQGFPLAYYKLGYHYLYVEQYLKASIIWKKFLALSKDDVLVQEIRNEIERIEDDVMFESGLTYLIYNDYEKSLDSLLKLMPKYKDNWKLNFSIGRCYLGLELDDLAIEYISEAIELKKEEADLYNELGIIYYNNGDVIKGIEVFTNGIDSCPKDFKLFYNRAMSYMLINEYENALEDINEAYIIEPNEEIKALRQNLENAVNSL